MKEKSGKKEMSPSIKRASKTKMKKFNMKSKSRNKNVNQGAMALTQVDTNKNIKN